MDSVPVIDPHTPDPTRPDHPCLRLRLRLCLRLRQELEAVVRDVQQAPDALDEDEVRCMGETGGCAVWVKGAGVQEESKGGNP